MGNSSYWTSMNSSLSKTRDAHSAMDNRREADEQKISLICDQTITKNIIKLHNQELLLDTYIYVWSLSLFYNNKLL